MKTFISSISNREYQESEKVLSKSIRKSIFGIILSEFPDFNLESIISISELNKYRQKYIAHYLLNEVGELSNLEQDVLKTIENEEMLSANLELDAVLKFTYGQRLADKIASFGGSWRFII
jgi:hypothetical protein